MKRYSIVSIGYRDQPLEHFNVSDNLHTAQAVAYRLFDLDLRSAHVNMQDNVTRTAWRVLCQPLTPFVAGLVGALFWYLEKI